MSEVVVDPRFSLPPNLVDVRYGNEQDGMSYYDNPPRIIASDDEYVYDDAPPVPNEYQIVSQTVRATSDGGFVVDVVFELPDVDGVKEYEFRVAKN